MLQPWQTGRIIKIENETAATRRFWIELPGADVFDFKPGQFVTLDLPIHERPNKRWRSYSIASWPDGTNVFELVIVWLEGGAGTTYLFNEAGVGTEFNVRGPQGVFLLPDPIDRDLFLVCTGTGIAPFRSMVHYIIMHNVPHRNIYMIFGTRQIADALYLEEMKSLEKELPEFHYLPTFSRENPDDPTIRRGYVHTVYEELVREKLFPTEGENPLPAYFYLCGWKNMVDEAKQRIQAMGFDKKAIRLELYG